MKIIQKKKELLKKEDNINKKEDSGSKKYATKDDIIKINNHIR
ncbi:hypothetical protein [uncultured Methanosphaera sp.]|nr:hypothetical protein [uncultured Methanosphaera sp.]